MEHQLINGELLSTESRRRSKSYVAKSPVEKIGIVPRSDLDIVLFPNSALEPETGQCDMQAGKKSGMSLVLDRYGIAGHIPRWRAASRFDLES